MPPLAYRLCPPLIISGLLRLRQRLRDPAGYREALELKRLAELPPMQPGATDILGWPFAVLDGRSFVALHHTFFKKRLYAFDTDLASPFIIDCGANIGVSVAWWKAQHPGSRVLAFEADPQIFRVLQKNCAHLPGVTSVNAAVWTQDGRITFLAKGKEGGHLAEFSAEPHAGASLDVPSVRLRSLLAERCDFLKIDIEGAEVDVIRDCQDVLVNVSRMFVEYHSFTKRPQLLGQAVACLENAGFRIHAHVELPSPSPFRELLEFNEKDLRLEVFCFRDSVAPAIRQIDVHAPA